MPDKGDRFKSVIESLSQLTTGQVQLVENVIAQLIRPYIKIWRNPESTFITDAVLTTLGDFIRTHHVFSKEPLSKDRFEYALEQALIAAGIPAQLAPKGNPGKDITINGIDVSLKTQAERNIRPNKIHISKYVELGKGR